MALRPRLDAPSVVLLVTALLVAIPALVLSIGPVGSVLAAGVVLFVAALLGWRTRLASPAVVAVGVVGLVLLGVVGGSAIDPAPMTVVAALPVLAGVAALEYALRRFLGRASVRVSADTEGAILAGAVTGSAWAGIVHVALPASDDFGVVLRDVGPGGFVEPVAGLVYVVAGPVLVVGLAVALVARFRLATPLPFAGLEVGSFLAGPGGDSVGSLASLLWVFGVPLLLAAAAGELWLRQEAIRAVRTRLGGS